MTLKTNLSTSKKQLSRETSESAQQSNFLTKYSV